MSKEKKKSYAIFFRVQWFSTDFCVFKYKNRLTDEPTSKNDLRGHLVHQNILPVIQYNEMRN